MRLENAGPRTWLLAAAAAWALSAWLLALFGMGGRIAPLPDDAALLRPLPALPTPAPERLGPLAQYSETASRPLFADDRRPHPFLLRPEAGAQQAKAFDYVLTSVMITPNFRMAILQAPDGNSAPLRIKEGEANESLPGWQLQSLDARSAVFIGPEGQRRLELRVYNGIGGEAPTASTAPPPGTQQQRPMGQPIQPPVQPPTAAPVADAMPVIPPDEATPPPVPTAQAQAASPQPATEQAQMEAIRKRIEARRAQLRQEALLEQQRKQQNQKPAK